MLSEIVYKYALSVLQGMGADIHECRSISFHYTYEQRRYYFWIFCDGDDVWMRGVELVDGLYIDVTGAVRYLIIDPGLFDKIRKFIDNIPSHPISTARVAI